MAITNFKDRETEKIWNGNISKKLPQNIQKRVLAKLSAIAAATELRDLRLPSSNHLEALQHDRKGQYSIRVNDQWRICFVWSNANATEVEVTDYH